MSLRSDLTDALGPVTAVRPVVVARNAFAQMVAAADRQGALVSASPGFASPDAAAIFSPVSTVRRWSRGDGLWILLNHALPLIGRQVVGCETTPRTSVIYSQSVKTTQSCGPQVFSAGKKSKATSDILTDRDGNLAHAVSHAADIQGRDGTPLMPFNIIRCFPWLRNVFADCGYAGGRHRQARPRIGKSRVEIIKPPDTALSLKALPRRWVLKRTFKWPGRSQPLVMDFEHIITSATEWLFI